MSAISELFSLRERLESQIRGLEAELDTISRTIKILERENGGFPQLSIAEVIPPVTVASPEVVHRKGLTEKCLLFLENDWMQPSAIRDRLIQTNYHMTDKGKLLSSVYATLKRLSTQGKVESKKLDGSTVFRRQQQERG